MNLVPVVFDAGPVLLEDPAAWPATGCVRHDVHAVRRDAAT